MTIQDLGDRILLCAVTLNMRFLNSRNDIVSLKFKARIYMFLQTQYFHKMLHSLVLNQTFHCNEVNKSGIE